MANDWTYIDTDQLEEGSPFSAWISYQLRRNAQQNENERQQTFTDSIETGAAGDMISTPSDQWRTILAAPIKVSAACYKICMDVSAWTDGVDMPDDKGVAFRLATNRAIGDAVSPDVDAVAPSITSLEVGGNYDEGTYLVELQMRSNRGGEYDEINVLGVEQQYILMCEEEIPDAHYEIVNAAEWMPIRHVGRVENFSITYGDYTALSGLSVWPWVTTASEFPPAGTSKVVVTLYHVGHARVEAFTMWSEGRASLADSTQYNAGKTILAPSVFSLVQPSPPLRRLPALQNGRTLNTTGRVVEDGDTFASSFFIMDQGGNGGAFYLYARPISTSTASAVLSVTVENFTTAENYQYQRQILSTTPLRAIDYNMNSSLGALNVDFCFDGWHGGDAEFANSFGLFLSKVVVPFAGCAAGDLIRVSATIDGARMYVAHASVVVGAGDT